MTSARYTFLHGADLHIDSPLRGLERYDEAPAEEIRAATRRAFEKLVAFAIDRGVAFVILAGDVFDGDWKDYNTGLWFTARLRELTEHHIRVYLLAGNHDADGKMTGKLQYPDGVYTFPTNAPTTFVDESTGARLHGQGFARAAVTENLAAAYPDPTSGWLNIGVLHTALSGREGHGRYAPCSPDTLKAKGYDYWALGHVHQREVVSEEPWIVFPGNLQARHVGETGAKGATLVTVDDTRVVSVESQPFDVARFARVEVDVSGCVDRAACAEAVAAGLARKRDEAEGRLLAVRVEVFGASRAHGVLRREGEAFVADCRDRANALGEVWVEKVKVETKGVSEASGVDIVETLGLGSSELLDAMGEVARQEVRELLGKLPPKIDLAQDGLDLRDDDTLRRLLGVAREDLVQRLLEEDTVSVKERGR